MKGLIIDEPWISLILLGKKTWEMRKTACRHLDRIALIREGSGRIVGTADTVTGGNIRNNHIYLPLEFFPHDAIGGSNRSETAARTISVTFSPGEMVETDIDRSKPILRARSTVRDFFERAAVLEGDSIRLTSTGPYCYEISKEANA